MNIPSSDVKSIGRRSEKETKKLNKRSPFSKSKKQFKGLGGGDIKILHVKGIVTASKIGKKRL
jgi:hypothetical protein